ncbi:MAG: hypothetical protein KDI12_09875, partial [Anaerolineae bacterium]|nr:hypothetical protein [Anaerolineae bacterium]
RALSMKEIMYNQNSILIAAVLFALLLIAVEVGYRLGLRNQPAVDEESRSHVNAFQASLLGVLALLLGFTFSLALQRFDSRSQAVVDESNAIGTTYLRSQLLPVSMQAEVQGLLRSYLDVRVQESTVTLSDLAGRQALLDQAGQYQNSLWHYAVLAAQEDKSPVTSGLFIQALNAMIDSFGSRNAALDRHVPEVVLFLLFAVFLLTWGIVGYAAGAAGHRPSKVAYLMLVLVVLLVFIIIDLDRPRRGLIEVDHRSLTTLQTAIDSGNYGDTLSTP